MPNDKDSNVFDEEGKRLAEIDKQFGEMQPYDRIRIINETRFYMAEAASAMVEIGRRLILLKEHEPHGEFTTSLSDIGIPTRTARRFMQAAFKYGAGKRAALTVLGKTKMLELITEDDEELDALAEGGTLAGLTLDDMDQMSTRELKEELQKAREKLNQERDLNEKIVSQKDNKINELDRKIHENEDRIKPWPEVVRDINIDITLCASTAIESFDALDAIRNRMLTEAFDDEISELAQEQMAVVYYDAIEQLANAAAQLQQDCEDEFGGYKDRARPMLQPTDGDSEAGSEGGEV